MNAIAPFSRCGRCLLSNAALMADTISALEWPAITIHVRRSAIGNIDRAAWRFRHSAPFIFGFQNSGESNAAIQLLPPYRQTRSFLGQLFHSLAVPRPGSSRRWIWNRERRSAPAESQHSFPSSIGRQVPFSNIYPTVPPPSMIALASSRILELGARLWKGCRRTGSHRVVRAHFVSQGIDSSDEKFQLLLLVLRGANPLLILATLTF
jgi:hypothetical protein